MKIRLFKNDGSANGTIEVSDAVFCATSHGSLMHQVITEFLANQRQGTAQTKGRSDVSGGGVKPWRQKGTGRARAGSNTSPLWRRGGKAFGPDPRDYYRRIPKVLRRRALVSALSVRAGENKMMVLEKLECSEPKTKVIVQLLKAMDIEGKKNLIITNPGERNIFLSARNIRNVVVKPVSELNAFDVLNSENVVFASREAIEKLQEVVSL